MSTLASWWFNEIFGDFLAGEYFLNVGGMILRVTDKDEVRERHFNGAIVLTTTTISQKYYSPFSETEINYKPATGKEILCYFEAQRSGGGQFASVNFKIWAGPTKDSKTGARDVLGTTSTASSGGNFVSPPFILKAGEYLNIERISGSATGVVVTKIVGVERDEI
ncbi:MAG: hypothetical protein OER82_09925 [Nitrosopumilus sp.]|nr:hypothetical protein [Nitrosopumilus sp.]MDH3779480.1 hypothetical protein [Nitrosopumilus sp.]